MKTVNMINGRGVVRHLIARAADASRARARLIRLRHPTLSFNESTTPAAMSGAM
jgi:hypothetical protein